MTNKTIITNIKGGVNVQYKGSDVDCYGKPEDCCTYLVCCDDEMYDGIIADYEGAFTWGSVVRHVVNNYRADVVQIEVD